MLGIISIMHEVDTLESLALKRANEEEIPEIINRIEEVCTEVINQLKSDFKK